MIYSNRTLEKMCKFCEGNFFFLFFLFLCKKVAAMQKFSFSFQFDRGDTVGARNMTFFTQIDFKHSHKLQNIVYKPVVINMTMVRNLRL